MREISPPPLWLLFGCLHPCLCPPLADTARSSPERSPRFSVFFHRPCGHSSLKTLTFAVGTFLGGGVGTGETLATVRRHALTRVIVPRDKIAARRNVNITAAAAPIAPAVNARVQRSEDGGMVTSSGEGASHATLVIDSDFSSSRTHHLLGQHPEAGLLSAGLCTGSIRALGAASERRRGIELNLHLSRSCDLYTRAQRERPSAAHRARAGHLLLDRLTASAGGQ